MWRTITIIHRMDLFAGLYIVVTASMARATTPTLVALAPDSVQICHLAGNLATSWSLRQVKWLHGLQIVGKRAGAEGSHLSAMLAAAAAKCRLHPWAHIPPPAAAAGASDLGAPGAAVRASALRSKDTEQQQWWQLQRRRSCCQCRQSQLATLTSCKR